jgi:hypothetical protein
METENRQKKEPKMAKFEEHNPLYSLPSEHYPSSRGMRTPFVVVLTILLLISGGSALAYTFVYQPYTVRVHNSQSTATAIVHATSTARVYATATADSAATLTAQITATASALSQKQKAYDDLLLRTPTFIDQLRTPDLYNWQTDVGSGTGCTFAHNAYTVTINTAHAFLPCLASNSHFSDFAYQVHMSIISGNASGLAFRANASTLQSYLFTIGYDGSYHFYVTSGGKHQVAKNIVSGYSDLITNGLQQDNFLTVIAHKHSFDFYVNGQYLTSANDTTLTSQQIGVVASSNGATTQVLFSWAEVWTLP